MHMHRPKPAHKIHSRGVLIGLGIAAGIVIALNREKTHWKLVRSFDAMAAQFDTPWGEA